MLRNLSISICFPPHHHATRRTHFTSAPHIQPSPCAPHCLLDQLQEAIQRSCSTRVPMHPLLLLAGERRRRWWWWGWGSAARHAVAWAGALALAVSVASFAPEAAFVWALAGGGGSGCGAGAVRVPLDGGGDQVCVPARMAGRTCADMIVPPAFAGLAVGASACFVRALAIGHRHGVGY